MNAPTMPPYGVRRRTPLPRTIRALVGDLPRVPWSAVVAAALNLVVRKRLPAHVYEHLGDRAFAIELRDLDVVMAFRLRGRRFLPVSRAGEAAPRISLDAASLATLAAPEDAPVERIAPALVVAGDPGLAAQMRRALAGIDVRRARRLLRRAARRAGVPRKCA